MRAARWTRAARWMRAAPWGRATAAGRRATGAHCARRRLLSPVASRRRPRAAAARAGGCRRSCRPRRIR
eukprot:5022594-Prymnesium_polylepis.1